MADNLTNTAEDLVLNWINAVGSPTRPTTPLKVALMTVNGSDSAAGTEVTGGTYTRQTIVFSTSAGSGASNNADLVFTLMPACTVVGVEVYENGGVRVWYGALSASKTVNLGDTFTITSGSLTVTAS